MNYLKDAINYYRDNKRKEKEKQRLINAKTNFHLLENLIQEMNGNPNLRVSVHFKDGTILKLITYNPKRNTIYNEINGVDGDLVIR